MSQSQMLLKCPARKRFALIVDDQSTRGGFSTTAFDRVTWSVVLITKQLIEIVRRLLLLAQTSQINKIIWRVVKHILRAWLVTKCLCFMVSVWDKQVWNMCTYESDEEGDHVWDACEQDTRLRAHTEDPGSEVAGAGRDA
jgi:hypothetical protein